MYGIVIQLLIIAEGLQTTREDDKVGVFLCSCEYYSNLIWYVTICVLSVIIELCNDLFGDDELELDSNCLEFHKWVCSLAVMVLYYLSVALLLHTTSNSQCTTTDRSA